MTNRCPHCDAKLSEIDCAHVCDDVAAKYSTSSREAQWDEHIPCDICGRAGSFDFYGDFYCGECIADLVILGAEVDEQ